MTITIGLGAALGILGIHSIMDIRRKEINVILAGACLAAGVAWQFFGQKTETAEILLSCLPGSVLLGTAYLTEQKIGYGDGWVVMAAGVWTGVWDIVLILTGGMLTCAGCSEVLLILKKVRKGDSLPFIPFLLLGCIGRMIV